MALPTPYEVSVRRWIAGGTPNPHGYSEPSYSDPEVIKVHAIAPGPTIEQIAAGRVTSEVAFTVYAPSGITINADDLVTFNGTEYEVEGDSMDMGHGPWVNPIAGVTFQLRLQGG